MLRKLFHILAAASVMVGCNTALLENSEEVGWLAVDFSCGDDTRAGETDLSGYSVSITGKAPLDYSLESTCGELPAVLELIPGDYEISVSSPNTASAAFTPIYSSSEDFTIEAGRTRSVSVVLANVQVTLLPSSTFNSDTVLSCSVTVSNGESELTWNLADVTAGQTGYFKDASVLYISLEGKAKNGNDLRYGGAIYDVRQSEHYKVTLGEYVPTI